MGAPFWPSPRVTPQVAAIGSGACLPGGAEARLWELLEGLERALPPSSKRAPRSMRASPASGLMAQTQKETEALPSEGSTHTPLSARETAPSPPPRPVTARPGLCLCVQDEGVRPQIAASSPEEDGSRAKREKRTRLLGLELETEEAALPPPKAQSIIGAKDAKMTTDAKDATCEEGEEGEEGVACTAGVASGAVSVL